MITCHSENIPHFNIALRENFLRQLRTKMLRNHSNICLCVYMFSKTVWIFSVWQYVAWIFMSSIRCNTLLHNVHPVTWHASPRSVNTPLIYAQCKYYTCLRRIGNIFFRSLINKPRYEEEEDKKKDLKKKFVNP